MTSVFGVASDIGFILQMSRSSKMCPDTRSQHDRLACYPKDEILWLFLLLVTHTVSHAWPYFVHDYLLHYRASKSSITGLQTHLFIMLNRHCERPECILSLNLVPDNRDSLCSSECPHMTPTLFPDIEWQILAFVCTTIVSSSVYEWRSRQVYTRICKCMQRLNTVMYRIT